MLVIEYKRITEKAETILAKRWRIKEPFVPPDILVTRGGPCKMNDLIQIGRVVQQGQQAGQTDHEGDERENMNMWWHQDRLITNKSLLDGDEYYHGEAETQRQLKIALENVQDIINIWSDTHYHFYDSILEIHRC